MPLTVTVMLSTLEIKTIVKCTRSNIEGRCLFLWPTLGVATLRKVRNEGKVTSCYFRNNFRNNLFVVVLHKSVAFRKEY